MTMFFGDLGNSSWVSRFLDRALVVGLPRIIFASPDPAYLHDCCLAACIGMGLCFGSQTRSQTRRSCCVIAGADVAQIWRARGDAYNRLLCFRSFSTVARPYDINNYALGLSLTSDRLIGSARYKTPEGCQFISAEAKFVLLPLLLALGMSYAWCLGPALEAMTG